MDCIEELLTKDYDDLNWEDIVLVNRCSQVVRKFGHGLKKNPMACYMCRSATRNPHQGNPNMCVPCGKLNDAKRTQQRDLQGTISVVTGGRIKIGYYTALRLLRCGSRVIITTRFERDALSRYAQELDSADWISRLHIYQVDFLSLAQVEKFVSDVTTTYPKLDYVINNAAQTIARPDEFYANILDTSHTGYTIRARASVKYQACTTGNDIITLIPSSDSMYFPPGALDEYGQQLDLRPTNSWMLKLTDTPLNEMIAVQIVNSIIPFYLNQRFIPVLAKSTNPFIINVSSMEGKFNRRKSATHPHTNMAKASLNMMTRTCGKDLKKMHNIVMVSVDTGWNTVEEPLSFHLSAPLDCEDGASRILDPILADRRHSGIFYKDFKLTDW